jgi:hypothetical protein
MGIPIISNRPQPQNGVFYRQDGYSLQTGLAVHYGVRGTTFKIVCTRDGIAIQGSYPMVGREGVEALRQMLARAIKHHEHLKSFTDGMKQVALDERTIELEERKPEFPVNDCSDSVM